METMQDKYIRLKIYLMHLPNKQCGVHQQTIVRGYMVNLWDNDAHPKLTICAREKDVKKL